MVKLQDIIDFFFRHSFSSKTVDKVHQRLGEEEDRAQQDEALECLWNEIGYPKPKQDTYEAFERVQRRLHLDMPPTTLVGRFRILPAWAKLAAIWFVPLLSLGLSVYLYDQTRQADPLAVVETYVPHGNRRKLTLPDGSQVWLNGGTHLIYPRQFARQNREVYLSGEAHFEVAKDRRKPFVVKTRGYDVKVLGTIFNISAYSNEDVLSTSLQEGAVEVLLREGKSVCLSPNEQLIYNVRTGEIVHSQIDARQSSQWMYGYLSFQKIPLDAVVCKLERVYGIHIHMDRYAFQGQVITAKFNKDESIRTVLEILQTIVPNLSYQIDGHEVYIREES